MLGRGRTMIVIVRHLVISPPTPTFVVFLGLPSAKMHRVEHFPVSTGWPDGVGQCGYWFRPRITSLNSHSTVGWLVDRC